MALGASGEPRPESAPRLTLQGVWAVCQSLCEAGLVTGLRLSCPRLLFSKPSRLFPVVTVLPPSHLRRFKPIRLRLASDGLSLLLMGSALSGRSRGSSHGADFSPSAEADLQGTCSAGLRKRPSGEGHFCCFRAPDFYEGSSFSELLRTAHPQKHQHPADFRRRSFLTPGPGQKAASLHLPARGLSVWFPPGRGKVHEGQEAPLSPRPLWSKQGADSREESGERPWALPPCSWGRRGGDGVC